MWNAENAMWSQRDLAQSQKWGGASREAVEVKRLILQQWQVVQRTWVVLCQSPRCQKGSETESGIPIIHPWCVQCQLPGSVFFTDVYLAVHREIRGRHPPNWCMWWERESWGVEISPEVPKLKPEFFHDQGLQAHSYLSDCSVSCLSLCVPMDSVLDLPLNLHALLDSVFKDSLIVTDVYVCVLSFA